jgi:hypothetical protein
LRNNSKRIQRLKQSKRLKNIIGPVAVQLTALYPETVMYQVKLKTASCLQEQVNQTTSISSSTRTPRISRKIEERFTKKKYKNSKTNKMTWL